MSAQPEVSEAAQEADKSGLDLGNYEVIRNRLLEHSRELARRAEALNARRQELFGGVEIAPVGTTHVQTDNNCIPRDITSLGQHLLLGFNVVKHLAQVQLSDALGLYRFGQTDGHYEAIPTSPDAVEGLLNAPGFQRDFDELITYYKESRLLMLRQVAQKLLAVFQVGKTTGDVRVFQWAVSAQGDVRYIDNRGEREHVFPPPHDFTWQVAGREHERQGRHPHLSIEDMVFVECIGGDLTLKVEDNTEEGLGVYAEPVEDKNQSLGDADVEYAVLGTLVLLRIRPYREKTWRHIVYDTRARKAERIDAIGQACIQLPENHGIVFPGGYYLQTGEHKVFDTDITGLEYQRMVRSPNGEDVLYVFHRRDTGRYDLLPYNMIRKAISTSLPPVYGYTLMPDGTMVVFPAVAAEPTSSHTLQVWQTPFTSDEHAARQPADGSLLGRVGNADLVRGISDCLSIRRRIADQEPTRQRYEDLIAAVTRTIDRYYWLPSQDAGDLLEPLKAIRTAADLVIDEFDKVVALRQQAARALEDTTKKQQELVRSLRPEGWKAVDRFMGALTALRTQRGHIITLRDMRYMDLDALQALEDEVVEQFDRISRATVDFLLGEDALAPLKTQLDEVLGKGEAIAKAGDATPLLEDLERIHQGLDVISEVVAGLEVEDATQRTTILEGISEVFALLNRVRATVQARRKELLSVEGRAEFAAQFKLFSQAVSSALALADTPEKCDEQLSRLMVQLEDLEGRFSEFDEFIGDLAAKREEVYEAFSGKKQTLLDERQRRAENLASAAQRIVQGVQRRARGFESADELNAYFASDAMVHKAQQIAEQLLELGDSVKSDEVVSKLKSARQEALRALRDRTELFEAGTDVIKFGRHRFNVNTQPLELTMVPRDERMLAHLTGTDFYEPVEDAAFEATKGFWDQRLVSETPQVYRGEYLAASILLEAMDGGGRWTVEALHEAERGEGLLPIVRAVAAERYDEGYERGLHDEDAAKILRGTLSLLATAGKLRHPPLARALAALTWAWTDEATRARWQRRARSLGRLEAAFSQSPAVAALCGELGEGVDAALGASGLAFDAADAEAAGRVLFVEIQAEVPRFTASAEAAKLRDGLLEFLTGKGQREAFEADLRALADDPEEQIALVRAWLQAFAGDASPQSVAPPPQDVARGVPPRGNTAPPELPVAVAMLVTAGQVDWETSAARTQVTVEGLLGQHPRVVERRLTVRLDEFLARLGRFRRDRVPGYRGYRKILQETLDRMRERLRLGEFMPRVLSSFVRNKLINEVYLPMIGDNLAKQLGAAGDSKRTDLMGLLLLISPPGYGKTTLMEYIASRLGLVFMKVNGPALGHSVTSLDPSEAPNATARQEVDKINLALEMGNNVMLYLDDIQHTHPELLQKFISLCDAQRRIEGVWRGRTRTYDLRGKKFCVVMAGNPYTESGEKFQIPDMLANRADVYNLGDVLEGKGEVFALSYIENSLTSNTVLAPLAGREQSDVYKLVRMARGEAIPTTELSHPYSAVELQEILAVFRHMFRVQEVLLAVNQQYIASASMDDAFRTEPRFQLQGSYRNMNKIAEKVASAMNAGELEAVLDDHYIGEAQTLTTGAEANMLKLAELRGTMSEAQRTRWAEIKEAYQRAKRMGGAEDDPVTRVTGTLSLLGDQLKGIKTSLVDAAQAVRAPRAPDEPEAASPSDGAALREALEQLGKTLAGLSRPKLDVAVTSEAPAELTELVKQQAELIQQTLLPLARAAAHNLTEGRELHQKLGDVLDRLAGAAQAASLPGPQERRTQPGRKPQRTPIMKSKSKSKPEEG